MIVGIYEAIMCPWKPHHEGLPMTIIEAMATAGENSRKRAKKYFSIECMCESYVNMYMDSVQ